MHLALRVARAAFSLLLIAAVAGAILLIVRGATQPSADTPARTADVRPASIELSIARNAPTKTIPQSFLGISTEYVSIPIWAKAMKVLERTLLDVKGPGPLMIRIGGNSAGVTFWAPKGNVPKWGFAITPAWLRDVSTIIKHTGAHVILDLNLITATPADEARWARAAVHGLPRGSIAGFEIGNEPDGYSDAIWNTITDDEKGIRLVRADKTGVQRLPRTMTPDSYAKLYTAYTKAVQHAAPGIPMLGPALAASEAHAAFITRILARPHRGLHAITVHRYPFSGCSSRKFSDHPTIARLLSYRGTDGVANSLKGVLRLGRAHHLPVRLTELNSITCGGVAGLSNAFATALWAPETLFALADAGVNSADIHVRATKINGAFAINARGLLARPLFYGMILFKDMLGPGARLVRLTLTEPARLNLQAWAVKSGRRTLKILLLDKGNRVVHIRLRLPTRSALRVTRMLAPSARATGHLTLGGRHLAPSGRWAGRSRTQTVKARKQFYVVTVAPDSAALVTTRLR